jgi:asparagine synthase (glutamine-hydrolysing)
VSAAQFIALLSRGPQQRSERITAFLSHAGQRGRLLPLLDSPTLLVLGTPGAPHVMLPGGKGLIWGHLFDRGGSRILTGGPEDLTGQAEHFVESYWGGYVALRTRNAAAEALRDPSGAISCYQATLDDVHIVTSAPHLLVEAGLVPAEIDWTILSQALVYRDLRPARTALRGISEVLPGTVVWALPTGLQTRCVWTPWHFTRAEDEITDVATAVQAVRDTAVLCLTAWGNCFDRPVVEISGGLDSAIVAAGLHESRCRPIGLTFGPAAGDPDETPYARAIASHLGIALRRETPRVDAVDILHSDAADLPRPCARNFAQAFDRPNGAMAAIENADAFFSGGGGDNIFCYLRSSLPAVDRLKRQGLDIGVASTINDLAGLAETTLWNVARRTARVAMRRGTVDLWPVENRFLSTAATAALPMPAGHPWIEAPAGALPGKRAHIASLIGVQNHLEGHGRLRQAPIISPLLSQPLMELCLSIPSWLWCDGGINRAIARAAFAGRLPHAVLARRTKGAFEGFCTQLLGANRGKLRAMLINGALGRAGLLDTEAIVECLARPAPRPGDVVRLLMLADAEAWAHSWEARASLPAAQNPDIHSALQ